jgi:putative ABC transport system substrate-binding protein
MIAQVARTRLQLEIGLPAASNLREFAEAGLLLTCGADLPDLFRRAAAFVDKIFSRVRSRPTPAGRAADQVRAGD